MILKVENIGRYPLRNVRITIMERIRYPEKKEELPPISLAPGEINIISSEPFKNKIIDGDNVRFECSVRWEYNNYYFYVDLPTRLDKDRNQDFTQDDELDNAYFDAVRTTYRFKGKDFSDAKAFRKEVLEALE